MTTQTRAGRKQLMMRQWALAGVVVLAPLAHAADTKAPPPKAGKKVPPPAPAAEPKKAPPPPGDLKRPAPPPVVATPPVPPKSSKPVDTELAPPPPGTRVIEAYGDAKPAAGVTAPASAPAAAAPGHHLLRLAVSGGVMVPTQVLGAGPLTALSVELQPKADLPVRARLGVGFEAHAGKAARTFAPPLGGYDAQAIDNQVLVPIELGAVAVPWTSGDNALKAGLSYGLVPVISQSLWLGSAHTEKGLGHQFALDAGYTRSFGALELSLSARYAVRRTAVGKGTSTIELPWYQALGVTVGLGYGF